MTLSLIQKMNEIANTIGDSFGATYPSRATDVKTDFSQYYGIANGLENGKSFTLHFFPRVASIQNKNAKKRISAFRFCYGNSVIYRREFDNVDDAYNAIAEVQAEIHNAIYENQMQKAA